MTSHPTPAGGLIARFLLGAVKYVPRDAEIVIAAGPEDGVQMAAMQGKDLADALVLKRPHQHFSTVDSRHCETPSTRS